MMQSTEHVCLTHPLPPGRQRMRYLKLTPGAAIAGAGPTTVRCAACESLLLSHVELAQMSGLVVRCPSCGEISMI